MAALASSKNIYLEARVSKEARTDLFVVESFMTNL